MSCAGFHHLLLIVVVSAAHRCMRANDNTVSYLSIFVLCNIFN